jgi:hypothetical protein
MKPNRENMRYLVAILSTSLILILALGIPAGYAVTIGPSQGFVQYKVTVDLNNEQLSFVPINNLSATVNETVSPNSEPGFVNLTLALGSSLGNFSYSKDTNASSLPEIFPIMPTLTNQSFSYQLKEISFNINLANIGQVPVTYNGTSYQATKYAVTFAAENQSNSIQGNGTITSMPSGLIYNAELSLNQTATISIMLQSTNLSLNAQSNGINPLGASIVGIAAVGAVVVAAPVILISKRKNRSSEKQESENKANPYDVD